MSTHPWPPPRRNSTQPRPRPKTARGWSRLAQDIRLFWVVWSVRRTLGIHTNLRLLWTMIRGLAVVLLLSACGVERPTCSGVSLGHDLVLTAQHCAPGVAGTPGELSRPDVQVGDVLTIVARAGCTGTRSGTVLSVDPDDNTATLSTYACHGNSGAPVLAANGQIVGLVIRLRLPDHAAIVELF